MSKFQYQNGGKNLKKWDKHFWVTKRGNKGITNPGKKDFSNRGSFRDFKSGERDFKLRQILKIGVRWISNWDRDYKSGKGLQFGAEQARMSRDTVIYLLQSLGIVINI